MQASSAKDMLKMTGSDLRRLHIVKKAIERAITQIEASKMLELSCRQIRRIATRIRLEGDRGVLHKLLGRSSNYKTQESIKTKALRITQTRYIGFGPTLASEKLYEDHKIKVDHDTLRRWFLEKNISYSQRKKRPHRSWRERKPCFGQMIQMDGSHHAWLEERGPKLVLMAYIDDATNNVYARFYDYEGTLPAMDSFYRYSLIYGLPQSIYCDKHTTYKSYKEPTVEEELEGITSKSQFQRALEDLGVQVIYAHSPQAKGRVERLFRTLQDRLVKELRIKKASNLNQANSAVDGFLISFNQRFHKKPANASDLHRPQPDELKLQSLLSIKHTHPLRNDQTIMHRGKLYLIKDWFQNPLPKKVIVQERLDQKTYFLNDKNQELYAQALSNPPKQKMIRLQRPLLPRKKRYTPPKDHFYRTALQISKTKQEIWRSLHPESMLKSTIDAEILQKFEKRLKILKQAETNNP